MTELKPEDKKMFGDESEEWVDCYNCIDGYSHHDCGEDVCCCLNPKDNVICDVCDGDGGWVEKY